MEKLFITKIIWHIKSESNQKFAEFDEQLRLIKANNSETAFNKAKLLGLQHQETLINNKGMEVSWNYVNVEFVKEITSFDDGIEICAHTVKVDNAQQYINEINVKAVLDFESNNLKLN